MKIAKRAEQKNVMLNKDNYTVNEINEMLARNEIFYFAEDYSVSRNFVGNWDFDKITFRIFTDDLDELKVVLDESKFYTTVAIGKNGKTYFVNI